MLMSLSSCHRNNNHLKNTLLFPGSQRGIFRWNIHSLNLRCKTGPAVIQLGDGRPGVCLIVTLELLPRPWCHPSIGYLIKSGEQTPRGQQLFVPAFFYDPSLIEHDDEVGIANRGKPVSDHHGGPSFH